MVGLNFLYLTLVASFLVIFSLGKGERGTGGEGRERDRRGGRGRDRRGREREEGRELVGCYY